MRFKSANVYYVGEWTDGVFGGYGEFTAITLDKFGKHKSCIQKRGKFANGRLHGLGYTIDENANWWFG
jgi:hypothetical protein